MSISVLEVFKIDRMMLFQNIVPSLVCVIAPDLEYSKVSAFLLPFLSAGLENNLLRKFIQSVRLVQFLGDPTK